MGWYISRKRRNRLMDIKHGNTTTLIFTNAAGISTKSASVEEHAGTGFHVAIESMRATRIRKAAMAASQDGYGRFFGPDRLVARAEIALVAHEQRAARIRELTPNSTGERRLYEEGRLAAFAVTMRR